MARRQKRPPVPSRQFRIATRSKTLTPQVYWIPVGSRWSSQRKDPIAHNLFSLSSPISSISAFTAEGRARSESSIRPPR